MKKILRDMVPWLVVVGVAGALVTFLVVRGHPVGRWGLAALLAAHGLVHLLFLVRPDASPGPERGPWPFDRRDPRAVRLGLPAGLVEGVGWGLLVVTVAGFVASAGVTLWGMPFGPVWTAGVVCAAVASLLLLGLYFNPGLLLGAAIDVVLLGAALWAPS